MVRAGKEDCRRRGRGSLEGRKVLVDGDGSDEEALSSKSKKKSSFFSSLSSATLNSKRSHFFSRVIVSATRIPSAKPLKGSLCPSSLLSFERREARVRARERPRTKQQELESFSTTRDCFFFLSSPPRKETVSHSFRPPSRRFSVLFRLQFVCRGIRDAVCDCLDLLKEPKGTL